MPPAASTIQNTDVQDAGLGDTVSDDGVAAFLSNLTGESKDETPPKETKDKASETEADTTETAADTGTDEGSETSDASTTEDSANDPEITVKVDGEEHKVRQSALMRLYGQEAALTRKSQETAEARKRADTDLSHAKSVVGKLLERAQARLKPYAEMDFFTLSHDLDREAFAQLRKDAQDAYADVQFFSQEAGALDQAMQARAAETYRAAAQEAVKVLSDPKTGIDGFNAALYNDMGAYAETQGLPRSAFNAITDPGAIKMIHKAMLYDRGQVNAKSAEAKVAKAKTKPTSRVLKPGSAKSGGTPVTDAMDRLKKTGTVDDAAEAFLASFGDQE